MRIKCLSLLFLLYTLPQLVVAQKPDSLANKLDSLKKQSDTAGQTNYTEPALYNEKTKITPRVFGQLLLDDFKQQALSPFQPAKHAFVRDAALVGVAVGFAFLDKPIQRWAVTFRNNNEWSAKPSKTLTNLGAQFEIIPLAAIATTGFIFKNEKLRTTTALAFQSYITATFWSTLFKELSGRNRPVNFDPNSELNSARFHGPFYKLPYSDNSAFPSGHTALAFAAATVYAKEYKDIPLVPFISYGIATLIGVSRITENRHWATDVIGGGLLGFACGTQVVNNYHRYARLKRQEGMLKKKDKKGQVSFKMDYSPFSGLQPGLVYTFRQ
ncbi:MAG TPA: phosphatase PAP2 family protein [Chitinophagaceae bacterium]|nr:phosphatase PAP2 family protein [Chitinophagaceae bacterium]